MRRGRGAGQAPAGPRLARVRVLAAEDVEVNRFILEDLNKGAAQAHCE